MLPRVKLVQGLCLLLPVLGQVSAANDRGSGSNAEFAQYGRSKDRSRPSSNSTSNPNANATLGECSYAFIATAADAEQVRRDCPVIYGNLTFALTLAENINLDGLKAVEGNVTNDSCLTNHTRECRNGGPPSPPAFSISSSTLQSIGGKFYLGEFPGLANLSLPRLKTIEGGFNTWILRNLTYLDITDLESVGYMRLDAVGLKTLRHKQLRQVTGDLDRTKGRMVYVTSADVDNVDSIFSYPLDTGNSTVGFDLLPNVRNVTLGVASAGYVSMTGNGNLTVTLGGAETTEMTIMNFTLPSGLKSIQRSDKLRNLTVDRFDAFPTGIDKSLSDLFLPFDQLGALNMQGEWEVERLILPPQAANWTGFQLKIKNCSALHLTSQFEMPGDDKTQTWYWPQKDMMSIDIEGNVHSEFL